MRRHILLTVSLLLTWLGAGATEVALTPVSGHPGDVAEVTVTMRSPGDATAMELDIPIPDGVTFVPGSVTPLVSAQYSCDGNVKEGVLKIVMYSLSLNPLPEGELLKFSLKMGKYPGSFTLNPTLILSDASGSRLTGDVSPATATVLSPYIQTDVTTVDFGRQPIRGTYTKNLTIRNTGNETLTVEGYESSVPEFVLDGTFPMEISAGSSANVNVVYSPTQRAVSVEESLVLQSNAINGNATVELKAVPFSVNELHVAERYSGNSDERVTVALRLNNMEPILGVQASFNLPEALVYEPGSVAGTGRGDGFDATATVNGNKLTLLMYSIGGKSMQEGDDNVLTFDLRLNGRSGSYFLTPTDVILSNQRSENMTSAVSGQSIQINAPSISVGTTYSFGDVAVGNEGTGELTLSNNGQAPLTVERMEFDNASFAVTGELPVTIYPRSSKSVAMKVAPQKEGGMTSNLNIYSNDPEKRLVSVDVSANAYEANAVTMSGEPNDDYTAYTLHVSLDNYTEITALQMDVKWIPGMTTSWDDMKMTSRGNSHSYSVADMGNGLWRIIIYSMGNKPFTGNEGELFSLTFHGTDFVNTVISAEKIVLSSASGQNYTSPGSSINVMGVDAVRVSKIVLSETEVELKAEETVDLTATVLPSNAQVKVVTWSSDKPEIASVSPEGKVTAHQVGEALITASANDDSGVTAQCKVTVIPTPASSITLNKTELTLLEGASEQLTATVSPETTTDKTVTWTSSAPEIASVSNDGTVTAVKYGTATITATCGSVSATCQVTVNPIALTGVTVSAQGGKTELMDGETVQLTATYAPENATKPVNVIWSSSDEEVANVDAQSGLVTAHAKVGTATITATANNEAGTEVKGTIEITVVATPAATVTLNKTELTLLEGASEQLTATVSPETTTDKTVTWTSSAPEIASVSVDGTVTAVKYGTATITATCGNVSATCQVTVNPIALTGLTVTAEDDNTELMDGETLQLTATYAPENATKPVTVTWSSSDEAVATVDAQSGLVTAHAKVGTATITATANNEAGTEVKGTIQISVVATPATRIELNVYELTLRATGSYDLTAKVLPATATDKTVSWKSDAPEVATVSETGKITALSVGTANITATCGEANAVCVVNVVPTDAEVVDLNKYVLSMLVGESEKLTATVSPETTTDQTISWSSSEPSVATVAEDGTVTAVSLGTTDITATCGSVSAICKVTVLPTPLTSLTVTAENDKTELMDGETVQLTATYAPENATKPVNVTWSSSDEEVATVDAQSGLVTAHAKVGTTTITATANNEAGTEVTGMINITVVATPASSITLNKTELTLLEGASEQLTATVAPETTTDKTVTWTSSAPEIASVSDDGTVTAVKYGTATITATCGSVSAICQVTVNPIALTGLTVTAEDDKTELMDSETVQLTATYAPENATKPVNVIWSSSDEEVATVDAQSGLVTAHAKVGTTTITATANNEAGTEVTGSINITVVATLASSITLNKTELTLLEGASEQLTATVSPETTTDKTVTWTSSAPEIASVSDDGTVTAVKYGAATITATCGSVSATCQVTVNPIALTGLTVTAEDDDTELMDGETVQLTATYAPENATKPVNVTWSSSDEEVATVDAQSGLVTAHAKVGTATITATANNEAGTEVTGSINITVVATPASSITLNKTELTLLEGASEQLTATVSPETTTDKTVTWTSSAPEIASVSDDGTVTAVKYGTATITATCGSVSATCQVTVNPIALTGLTVTAEDDKTELMDGETLQLTATYAPENATQPVTVTWSSSDEAVATVDVQSGLVTAHAKVGTAIITATANNEAGTEVTGTIEITVVATPASSITLNKTELTLEEEKSEQLFATVGPDTTTDKTVVWTSSNPRVAEVSVNGTVTALQVGTATITATCGDAFATCEVTVTKDTGIGVIGMESLDGYEIYTLGGVRLKDGVKPVPGIYIVRKGAEVRKVIVK